MINAEISMEKQLAKFKIADGPEEIAEELSMLAIGLYTTFTGVFPDNAEMLMQEFLEVLTDLSENGLPDDAIEESNAVVIDPKLEQFLEEHRKNNQ